MLKASGESGEGSAGALPRAGLSGIWIYVWKDPEERIGREISGEVPETGSADDPAIPRGEVGTGHRGSLGNFAGMGWIFSFDRDSYNPMGLGLLDS